MLGTRKRCPGLPEAALWTVQFLRDAEDLSFLQIGKRVGLKEDAARMRYKRAVQKLTRAVVMIKSGKLEAVLAGLEEEANG